MEKEPPRNIFDIQTSKIDGQTVSLFGIFDGESYQQTDAAFLDSKRDTYRDDVNHLYVANVGDSRTVISKAGEGGPRPERKTTQLNSIRCREGFWPFHTSNIIQQARIYKGMGSDQSAETYA